MHAAELALAGSARIDGDVVIACCGLAGSGVRAALAVEAGQGAWVPAESPELLGRLDPVFRARDGSLPGVAVHAPEAGGVAVVALNVAPKPGQEGMLAVRVMRMLESQGFGSGRMVVLSDMRLPSEQPLVARFGKVEDCTPQASPSTTVTDAMAAAMLHVFSARGHRGALVGLPAYRPPLDVSIGKLGLSDGDAMSAWKEAERVLRSKLPTVDRQLLTTILPCHKWFASAGDQAGVRDVPFYL